MGIASGKQAGCSYDTQNSRLFQNSPSASGTPECTALNNCICFLSPPCLITDGQLPNSDTCMCGTTSCTGATGLRCYLPDQQCGKQRGQQRKPHQHGQQRKPHQHGQRNHMQQMNRRQPMPMVQMAQQQPNGTYRVLVPNGVAPGEQFVIQVDGEEFKVQCPYPSGRAGDVIELRF